MNNDRNLKKLTSLLDNCITYAHQTGLFKCGMVDIGPPMRCPEEMAGMWYVKIKGESGAEVTFEIVFPGHGVDLDTFKAEDVTTDILARFAEANMVLCRKRDEALSICVGAEI